MNDADRRILAIGGAEAHDFLQGLSSNDVPNTAGVLRYGALLTPQGKYLCDFFMFVQDGTLYVDAPATLFDDLRQRLTMYRLRRKITLDEVPMAVARGTGPVPAGALPDPRHPAFGWRGYGPGFASDTTDWDALRVEHCVPAAGIELIPNESYLLESGFERLNGIDFRKGCYVGQEINARMKHKTELKKGLVTVAITGSATVGTPITTADGKPAGQVFTQSCGRAIAYLRFDRVTAPLVAGSDAIICP